MEFVIRSILGLLDDLGMLPLFMFATGLYVFSLFVKGFIWLGDKIEARRVAEERAAYRAYRAAHGDDDDGSDWEPPRPLRLPRIPNYRGRGRRD